MKPNNLIKTSLFLTISAITFTSAYADVTRHIYNDSNNSQTVRFSKIMGDILFNSGCNGQSNDGSCVIPPHSSAEFIYHEDGFGKCSGSVELDVDSQRYDYSLYNSEIISGDGTAYYQLNAPTPGDIHFYNK